MDIELRVDGSYVDWQTCPSVYKIFHAASISSSQFVKELRYLLILGVGGPNTMDPSHHIDMHIRRHPPPFFL